jgi:site-specific DNA-methyltransferase (adenine-specific)
MSVRRTEHLSDDVVLHLGDCLEILPTLGEIDACISDPPYGMNWNTDSSRFSGGHRASVARRGQGRDDWGSVFNDNKIFDPTPFLKYDQVVLFGSNHFCAYLPVGTTLVWLKRLDPAFGSFLSDGEIAWQKGGYGVYAFRDTSNMALANDRLHPTQKPVPLMRWCIERQKPAPRTILDSYLGSGTTGVACVQLGRKFIGIEIEERYFSIACRRIADELRRPRLPFDEHKPAPITALLPGM